MMKNVLPILLVCILVGNALSDKSFRKRIVAHSKKSWKNLQASRAKPRKLEETDIVSTDIESGIPNGTVGNTTAPPVDIPVNQTVAKTPKKSDNTGTALQIKKFHNFAKEERKIVYNVFFYFLGRPIAQTITIRIKIIYNSSTGLRNLDDELKAQSVASSCNIKDEYKDKIGTNGTGDNIDYNCEAPTEAHANVTNAVLDTDYPLVADNQEISFNDINFDQEAAQEASNIAAAKTYKVSGVLDNSKVEFGQNSFKITGTPKPSNLLSGVSEIPMRFIDYSSGEANTKDITCNVTSSTTLECNQSLKSYISNITQAKSTDDSILLNINIADEETGKLVGTTSENNSVYRKSSGGLSGGAIAGIVVGCAAVLIAAVVAAILLRRPKVNNENLSAVNLKSVENI